MPTPTAWECDECSTTHDTRAGAESCERRHIKDRYMAEEANYVKENPDASLPDRTTSSQMDVDMGTESQEAGQ